MMTPGSSPAAGTTTAPTVGSGTGFVTNSNAVIPNLVRPSSPGIGAVPSAVAGQDGHRRGRVRRLRRAGGDVGAGVAGRRRLAGPLGGDLDGGPSELHPAAPEALRVRSSELFVDVGDPEHCGGDRDRLPVVAGLQARFVEADVLDVGLGQRLADLLDRLALLVSAPGLLVGPDDPPAGDLPRDPP